MIILSLHWFWSGCLREKIRHIHLFSSYLFAEQMRLKCGSIDFVHWLFSSFSVSTLPLFFYMHTYLLWWTSLIWGHISYRKGSFRSIEEVFCRLSCQSSWCKKAGDETSCFFLSYSLSDRFTYSSFSYHKPVFKDLSSLCVVRINVFAETFKNSFQVSDCILCAISVGSVFLHCVQTVDSD